MQVSMPMSGFVAGQIVPITILVINPTKTTIESIDIIFFKGYRYNFKLCFENETISQFKEVDTTVCPGAVVQGTRQYYVNYKVPDVPASGLGRCDAMDIFYKIVFMGKVL
jgi:hypothetical protein